MLIKICCFQSSVDSVKDTVVITPYNTQKSNHVLKGIYREWIIKTSKIKYYLYIFEVIDYILAH